MLGYFKCRAASYPWGQHTMQPELEIDVPRATASHWAITSKNFGITLRDYIDVSVPPLPPRVLFACSPYILPYMASSSDCVTFPPCPPCPAEGMQDRPISSSNGEPPGPNPNGVTKIVMRVSLWAGISSLLAATAPSPSLPTIVSYSDHFNRRRSYEVRGLNIEWS